MGQNKTNKERLNEVERGCHEPDENGGNSTINTKKDDGAASMRVSLEIKAGLV